MILIYLLASLVFVGNNGCPAMETADPKTENDCLKDVLSIPDNLGRYKHLRELQISNENEFYRCLIHHVEELMPIVYTPVVGEACENYGRARVAEERALTLKITEAADMESKLMAWKQKYPEVKAIVVTDGERILGLGDLGANGMGIPVGKMALYSALGGVHPRHCLPITLDVGTNNEKFLADNGDLYVGIKERRKTGPEYYQFIEQFMTTAIKVFGRGTLIQFEDFLNKNAFKLLDEYRGRYTVFNDDIQGTAAVALAGVLAAEKAVGRSLKDSVVLFAGAGEAGVGIAKLMVEYLKRLGMSEEEAKKNIWMKRSDKLIMQGDKYDDKDERKNFLQSLPPDVPADANIKDLREIIEWLKPNILIGVSSVPGLFDENVLKEMANQNPTQKPIIFALSNPSKMSECTAEDAYKYTEGRVLFASGSPFGAVEWKGETFYPRQCNNAYIFPGVALAVTATQMTSVPEDVFLIAAKTLANVCTEKSDLDHGSLFPSLALARECSIDIATEIAKYAFDKGLSMVKSPPSDARKVIVEHHYSPTDL